MSLVFEILEALSSTKLNYKGVAVNLYGVPKFKGVNQRSFAVTLSRLRSNQYIEKNQDGYTLTPRGRKFFEDKARSLKNFEFQIDLKEKSKKEFLVIFDIPEERKAEREWFRFHLRKLGFKMIQKSVWVGPTRFPKEFSDYIRGLGLTKSFKVFKISNAKI